MNQNCHFILTLIRRLIIGLQHVLLADRTNGRAYATVLRLSVRLSVCL